MIIVQVLQREVVSRIQSQPDPSCFLGGSDERCDGCGTGGGLVGGVGLSVQFHPVGTTSLGTLHHLRVGIDEDARADTGILECLADILEERFVLDGVPTVVTRDLVMTVRHQCHLLGSHLQYQFDERVDGVALDIELRGNQRFQVSYVLVADVPLVRTRVYGDTLCAKLFYVPCHRQYVRVIATSGIA